MASDGCTGWFDGWPEWLGGTGDEWLHCCANHDQAYLDLQEHGLAVYVQFHLELMKCVAEISPIMSVIMGAALFTFGWFIVNARNLKLIGWPNKARGKDNG